MSEPYVPTHIGGLTKDQDAVQEVGTYKISKYQYFLHGNSIPLLIKWFQLLRGDGQVSKHSDTYMIFLQILCSCLCLKLDPVAADYLSLQANAHLGRYGLTAFATRRSFLNLFRFLWSTNRLQEATLLAERLGVRIKAELSSVAPDSFLIWKTLAADVECRKGGCRRRAASLYKELARQYSQYPGPSNRSYQCLHSALQLFYTGQFRWRDALGQLAEAAKWLDSIPQELEYATETLMERRVALLVQKAAVLEAMSNVDGATRTYRELMEFCEQHLDEDAYIESWHRAADRRIMVLNLANRQNLQLNGNKFTNGPGAVLTSPVLQGVSLARPPGLVQDYHKLSQDTKLISTRPFKATKYLPPTSGTTIKPFEQFCHENCSALTEFSADQMTQTLSSWRSDIRVQSLPPPPFISTNTNGLIINDPMEEIKPIKKYKNRNNNMNSMHEAKYPELYQVLLYQARKTAALMEDGLHDGRWMPFTDPNTPCIAGVLPQTRWGLLPSSSAPSAAWSPEEGAVLAEHANRGLHIRSTTLLRMLWCYANQRDRTHVFSYKSGTPHLSEGAMVNGRPYHSIAYFLGQRHRVLGRPHGSINFTAEVVCDSEYGPEQCLSDEEKTLRRALRGLRDAAKEELQRQRRAVRELQQLQRREERHALVKPHQPVATHQRGKLDVHVPGPHSTRPSSPRPCDDCERAEPTFRPTAPMKDDDNSSDSDEGLLILNPKKKQKRVATSTAQSQEASGNDSPDRQREQPLEEARPQKSQQVLQLQQQLQEIQTWNLKYQLRYERQLQQQQEQQQQQQPTPTQQTLVSAVSSSPAQKGEYSSFPPPSPYRQEQKLNNEGVSIEKKQQEAKQFHVVAKEVATALRKKSQGTQDEDFDDSQWEELTTLPLRPKCDAVSPPSSSPLADEQQNPPAIGRDPACLSDLSFCSTFCNDSETTGMAEAQLLDMEEYVVPHDDNMEGWDMVSETADSDDSNIDWDDSMQIDCDSDDSGCRSWHGFV
ncbi:hypothetical protein PG993_015238 [Apiospora rasikravindrae]|uniref:Uncharacterized protein n=1 Tax=Apiospora rasikravindrae TaxID=990691 RepID=A0ABR1RQ11_9PEZI